MNKTTKKTARSEILDIVDHTPERLDGESFEKYQKRRKLSQKTIDLYLQGEKIKVRGSNEN